MTKNLSSALLVSLASVLTSHFGKSLQPNDQPHEQQERRRHSYKSLTSWQITRISSSSSVSSLFLIILVRLMLEKGTGDEEILLRQQLPQLPQQLVLF